MDDKKSLGGETRLQPPLKTEYFLRKKCWKRKECCDVCVRTEKTPLEAGGRLWKGIKKAEYAELECGQENRGPIRGIVGVLKRAVFATPGGLVVKPHHDKFFR